MIVIVHWLVKQVAKANFVWNEKHIIEKVWF